MSKSTPKLKAIYKWPFDSTRSYHVRKEYYKGICRVSVENVDAE